MSSPTGAGAGATRLPAPLLATQEDIAGGWLKPLDRPVTIWLNQREQVTLDAVYALENEEHLRSCAGCVTVWMFPDAQTETCYGTYCPDCDTLGYIGACCREHFGRGSE
jgi:hypothetical protein